MKHRKTLALTALALLALLPLVALASPGERHGRGPGRGMFPPPGYLDLSDEQIEATQAILEGVRAEMSGTREERHALREELKAILDSDNPDANAAGQLVISLHDLRQQTRAILEDAENQFAALLTAEQLEKWENFKELRESRRGRRGPGRGGDFSGDGFGRGAERGPIG